MWGDHRYIGIFGGRRCARDKGRWLGRLLQPYACCSARTRPTPGQRRPPKARCRAPRPTPTTGRGSPPRRSRTRATVTGRNRRRGSARATRAGHLRRTGLPAAFRWMSARRTRPPCRHACGISSIPSPLRAAFRRAHRPSSDRTGSPRGCRSTGAHGPSVVRLPPGRAEHLG